MIWTDFLRTSLGSLWRRKLRSSLTMLGVAIGTTAIVVTISLGIGAEENTMAQISSYADITIVDVYRSGGYYYYDDTSQEGQQEGPQIDKLTDAIIADITKIPHVVMASPIVRFYYSGGAMKLKTGKFELYPQIIAMYPGMLESMGYKIKEGRSYSASSELEFVLSPLSMTQFYDPKALAKDPAALYQYFDPNMYAELGEDPPFPDINWLTDRFKLMFDIYENATDSQGNPKITTKSINARVVGRTALKAGGDYELQNAVFVNITALNRLMATNKKLFGDVMERMEKEGYDSIKIKVDSFENVEPVLEGLRGLGLAYNSPIQWIEQSRDSIRNIQALLGAIGGISLLVAAIGIANTMMMSIYERTREIGVMKVLGCRMGYIRILFLLEAAFIGVFGGLVGVAMSYGLSYAVNESPVLKDTLSQIMGSYESFTGRTSVIPLYLAMGAWVFGTVIALLSGFYPARRAMRLSSLAAIRNQE